jgi:hypothetical protein
MIFQEILMDSSEKGAPFLTETMLNRLCVPVTVFELKVETLAPKGYPYRTV